MPLNYDVIVTGSYSIDFIFTGMDELPQLGKDIHSKALRVTPGEAYITAVGLHRLGVKVGWAADFGNDEYSQLALKCSREEGLDESLFVYHDRPYRRISAAASYPQERGFLTYYDPDPQIPAAFQALAKSESRYIFLPGLYYGPMFEAGLQLVRLKKMKVVMDGNSSDGDILGKTSQCKAIRKAIKSTDIFLPNSTEAKRLTGQSDLNIAALTLLKLSPLVVIKDGINGSISYQNNSIIRVPGIPINPVDTTGAGDNFNSGFLRALLDGQTIENCLKWGNVTGGLSTFEPGGTTYKITIDSVRKAILRYYP